MYPIRSLVRRFSGWRLTAFASCAKPRAMDTAGLCCLWSEATDCCLSRYIKFWMSMILIWYKKHHSITQRNTEICKTQECPLQAILEDRLQDFGSTKQTKASEYFHFAWTLAPSVGPREVAADNAWSRQVAWKLENDFDSNSGWQSASEAIQLTTANTGWKMQCQCGGEARCYQLSKMEADTYLGC